VPFTEDEDAVGHLGAGGEDEPFRVGVGSWALRWDLAHGDAGVGQDGVEEITSEDDRCLRAQEPPPGGVVAA
jgi:hypothetical protein